jgi:quercetin dioxygenase-like cupin family protein
LITNFILCLYKIWLLTNFQAIPKKTISLNRNYLTMKSSSNETLSGRKVYVNPVIGDKVTFIESSAETGGARTLIHIELAAHGGNTLHIHDDFAETFIVLEGSLKVRVGNKYKVLQPGDVYTIPPKMPHYFQNPTDGIVQFQVKLEPGHEGFEQGLKIAYGLARDGLTDKKSMPKKFSHIALLVTLTGTSPTGIFAWFMPIFRWKAAKARKQGILKALIKKYS